MTRKEWRNLKEGDHVRHVTGKDAYIITHILPDTRVEVPTRYIATRTINITHPDEWEKVGVKK